MMNLLNSWISQNRTENCRTVSRVKDREFNACFSDALREEFLNPKSLKSESLEQVRSALRRGKRYYFLKWLFLYCIQ